MSSEEIYHYLKVNDQLITGGQPTEAQLQSISAEGFSTVINLATINSPRALDDEASLVRSLGMGYVNIPVDWENPQEGDFEAFEQAMARLSTGKTLIHCAANLRVTVFYALYAQKHLGWSEAQADEFRAAMWAGRDYPIWEQFIAHMRKQMANS